MKRLIIILMILCMATPCFAKFQALILVPESLNKELIPEEIMNRIKLIGGEWTDDPVWNTQAYEGQKLISFAGNTTVERLNLFIEQTGLNWTILAANDGYIPNPNTEIGGMIINTLIGYDPDIVIKYIKPKYIYDVEGNFLRTELPIKIEIGKFSGLPNLQPAE